MALHPFQLSRFATAAASLSCDSSGFPVRRLSAADSTLLREARRGVCVCATVAADCFLLIRGLYSIFQIGRHRSLSF
jgi:hypothetical protein